MSELGLDDLTTPLADGTAMPLVGLGTWRLEGSEASDAVRWALEAGYRHIDTATMYANEAQVGAGLRDAGVRREDVFVTTKLPPDHVGREQRTLDASLAALGVDHVDLWLVHWPPGGGAGLGTWREFVRAREDGRARAIGVSNYSLAQVDELTARTGVTPAVNQVKWSPALYDRSFAAGCRDRGVTLEGYSPFRAGRLDHPTITEIADRHGRSPAQVVVRWHVEHGVVVIPKSARRERIVSNADVAGFSLGPEDVAAIDALGRAS